jgi:hypothetical protein
MNKNKQKQPKQNKRRKPNKRRGMMFPPVPDNFNVSLRYTSRSQVSGTSFSVYNFDLTTLQTLQPTYRDQLLAIWNQYVVLGATIDVKLVNKSTTVDAEVLLYHGDGYTVSGLTFNQALEYKHTQRIMLTSSGNQKCVTLSKSINLASYLPKRFFDDSNFWGNATSGPSYSTSRGYQHAVGIIAADGASSVSVTMDRRITFHVRFFTLAAITNSLSSRFDHKPFLAGDEICSESDESHTDSPKHSVSRKSNSEASDIKVAKSSKGKGK